MSFEDRGEAVIAAHDHHELKDVYRVLHAHLAEHPQLMDSDFMFELQDYLQRRARAEGVDTRDHGAWETWLGGSGASCADRVRRRRTLDET